MKQLIHTTFFILIACLFACNSFEKITKKENEPITVESLLDYTMIKEGRVKKKWMLETYKNGVERKFEKKIPALEIEKFVEDIQKEANATYVMRAYSFQSTPRGTVEHVFMAAKEKDYSKLKYLVDPYMQNINDEIFFLYIVDIFPEKIQNWWSGVFQNGEIIGEPQTLEGRCSFKVAYGKKSDDTKLTGNVRLVKRAEKWYFQAFPHK